MFSYRETLLRLAGGVELSAVSVHCDGSIQVAVFEVSLAGPLGLRGDKPGMADGTLIQRGIIPWVGS